MNHLVIMAKKPVAGAVKTRLAADVGTARATGFYRNLLRRTCNRLGRDPRWQTWLAVAPQKALGDAIWPTGINQIAQIKGDLGQRMQALLEAFAAGPVIIIGSDIPDITPAIIADAFNKVGRNDMVFGSAGDGGFWLVGARCSPKIPKAFANVRWSGPHALADTMANLTGLSIGQAARLQDIDTGEDFRAWRKSQV